MNKYLMNDQTIIPLEELLKCVDNKYMLVVGAARRARQIADGAPPLVNPGNNKPPTIALREIVKGLVKISLAPKDKKGE
ncbi:MAG: DNA-directed RNA polymerase subunit omega [bacterium]